MKQTLLIVFLIIVSTMSLFCSFGHIPLFKYVDDCDLIIQGELVKIDSNTSVVTYGNVRSIRDTAYIKIKSIYKNNSQINCDAKIVKLIVPAKNRTTEDGLRHRNSNSIFYDIGQDGIWLLKAKGEYYTATHPNSFQEKSNEKYIKLLCNINAQTFQFLDNIRLYDLFENKLSLESSLIDINDSIFSYPESNPILYAVKRNRVDIIQDLIDYGFDVNFTNERNENALFLGVQRSRRGLDVVETLLKNGIETTLRNIKGESIYDRIDKMDNKEELIELFNKYKLEKE
jgi:hypothetical protein